MGLDDVLRVGGSAVGLGLISAEVYGRRVVAVARGELEGDPRVAFAGLIDAPTLAALVEGREGVPVPSPAEGPSLDGPTAVLGVIRGGGGSVESTDVEAGLGEPESREEVTQDGSFRRRVRTVDPLGSGAAHVRIERGPEQSASERAPAWSMEGDRYRPEAVLGRGALGRVEAARDLFLGRTVALKTAIADGNDEHARIFHEARLAAQLEHPSVVPVYDAGRLPDGRPFYTMRVVRGRSLAEILAGLRRGEGAAEWTLQRLLGAYRQVCLGLEYAHARGVVHCDLKPGNVMLGAYGEVQVVDWGLARVVRSSDEDPLPLDPDSRATGGTPAYMAPEQATGEARPGAAIDVYALGVILFELLTLRRPFEGDDPQVLLTAHLSMPPPAPSSVAPAGREVPASLEELALRALAKEPLDRPPSARVLADEIEAYLEGRKDRERREAEASRALVEARRNLDDLAALEAGADATRAQLAEVRRRIAPYDPLEVKQRAWALEDHVRETERSIDERVGRSTVLLDRSLALSPDDAEARDLRARLYAEQLVRLEAIGDVRGTAYYGALAREYATPAVARLLDARGVLTVRSSPDGALVRVFRYVERDRRLVPELCASPGHTPVAEVVLASGSYLVVLEHAGFVTMRAPARVRRGAREDVTVTMVPEGACPPGFVPVPSGSFVVGGDPIAPEALPAEEVELGDVLVARFPVTRREYDAWLDALGPEGSVERRRRTPYERTAEGRADPTPRPSSAQQREQAAEAASHMAVQGVSWFDAMGFVAWRSRRDDVRYRLLTDVEWERVARGADARLYPWGDTFDATFCKMRDSRPGPPRPEPIGTFPADESPFGARDLAGSTREWVADVHGGKTQPDVALEDGPDVASVMAVIRGGAWDKPAVSCRSAARLVTPAINRFALAGLRLAIDRSQSR
ncbi:MAG: SUMF1/EgtB/PvdO family nonheme iron enzyme [Deltaproteobacteria bacterium]|nr:SUMF1/EgtB/PvdO family nonheme iron enzyme [Deltaproteobacteria bacterium]